MNHCVQVASKINKCVCVCGVLTPASRGVGNTVSPSGPWGAQSWGDMVGDSSIKGSVSEPSWDLPSSPASPSYPSVL